LSFSNYTPNNRFGWYTECYSLEDLPKIKAKVNQTLSKTKQSESNKTKLNEIKLNKTKLNNTEIIPKGTEEKSSDKSNPDINNLIIEIKNLCNKMWVSYDKTKDRMFWKHICWAKDYWEFCEKINQSRTEFALNIIKASIKIDYWKWVCAWPMKIYQNYADVYNKTKQVNTKNTWYILPWID
jgi:hypothetical protein